MAWSGYKAQWQKGMFHRPIPKRFTPYVSHRQAFCSHILCCQYPVSSRVALLTNLVVFHLMAHFTNCWLVVSECFTFVCWGCNGVPNPIYWLVLGILPALAGSWTLLSLLPLIILSFSCDIYILLFNFSCCHPDLFFVVCVLVIYLRCNYLPLVVRLLFPDRPSPSLSYIILRLAPILIVLVICLLPAGLCDRQLQQWENQQRRPWPWYNHMRPWQPSASFEEG